MKKIFLLTFFIISFNLYSESGFFYISDTNVRLRSEPNTDSEIITLLQYGDKLEILEHNSDFVKIGIYTGQWYRINHQGKSGWVLSCFVSYNFGLKNQKTYLYRYSKIIDKNVISSSFMYGINNGEILYERSGDDSKILTADVEKIVSLNSVATILTSNNEIMKVKIKDFSTQGLQVLRLEIENKITISEGIVFIGDIIEDAKFLEYRDRKDKYTHEIRDLSKIYFYAQINQILYPIIGRRLSYEELFLNHIRKDSFHYEGKTYSFYSFFKHLPIHNNYQTFRYNSNTITFNNKVYCTYENINLIEENRETMSLDDSYLTFATDLNGDSEPELWVVSGGYESSVNYLYICIDTLMHRELTNHY